MPSSQTIYRICLLPNLSDSDHIKLESPPVPIPLLVVPHFVQIDSWTRVPVESTTIRGSTMVIDLSPRRVYGAASSALDNLLDDGWVITGHRIDKNDKRRIVDNSKYLFDDEFRPTGLKRPQEKGVEPEPPRSADQAKVSPFSPTPWSVQKKTDSDYDEYTTIVAANGCEVTAATTFCNEGGVSGARPDLSAADAERIVACVNACAAFTTEELVNGKLAILKYPAMANLHRVEIVQPATPDQCEQAANRS